MLPFIQKKTNQESPKLQLSERVNEFIATKKEPGFSVKLAASPDASVKLHPLRLPYAYRKTSLPWGSCASVWSAVISLWGSAGGGRQERVGVLRRVKSLSKVCQKFIRNHGLYQALEIKRRGFFFFKIYLRS